MIIILPYYINIFITSDILSVYSLQSMKETRVADSYKKAGLPGSIQEMSSIASPALLNQLREELLTEYGRYWDKITYDSIYPLMQEGEQVFVKRVFQDEIQFGFFSLSRILIASFLPYHKQSEF